MLADAQAGTEKTRMVRTEFAMNARELDQGRGGDYWTTPHEMAARAFQGYVEDKIAEQGGTSRFLNYGPANASILTPWGFKRPFPSGQERVAINEAFDGFIKTLQTREDDAGNVPCTSPTPRSTVQSSMTKTSSEIPYPRQIERVEIGHTDLPSLLGTWAPPPPYLSRPAETAPAPTLATSSASEMLRSAELERLQQSGNAAIAFGLKAFPPKAKPTA